jgi:hypothetical protein
MHFTEYGLGTKDGMIKVGTYGEPCASERSDVVEQSAREYSISIKFRPAKFALRIEFCTGKSSFTTEYGVTKVRFAVEGNAIKFRLVEEASLSECDLAEHRPAGEIMYGHQKPCQKGGAYRRSGEIYVGPSMEVAQDLVELFGTEMGEAVIMVINSLAYAGVAIVIEILACGPVRRWHYGHKT